MSRIAIIPARGGSKRIPNKNSKNFHGRPILAYSIEAAIKSNLYDEVMVSTDDEKIAKIALEYGAKVPFYRSKKNSDDFATTVDVLLEVLEYYNSKEINFKQATCIYACAPFITPNLLIESFKILDNNTCDCVFPSIAYSHPIQRAIFLNEQNKVENFDFKNSNIRTQDFQKAYYDAGMFYSFDVNKLIENKNLRTDNTYSIEIQDIFAQDIDNENDWILAELKYNLFLNAKL